MTTKIAIFKKKEIRKIIHNNEWWFAINDVILALTDSRDPAQYFKRMKSRDAELKKLIEQGEVQFVTPLRLEVAGSARKDLEKKSGKKISTSKNYLGQSNQMHELPEK
jgi:DNA-damage-inducible protein D